MMIMSASLLGQNDLVLAARSRINIYIFNGRLITHDIVGSFLLLKNIDIGFVAYRSH